MKKEELTKKLILSATPFGLNELVDIFIMDRDENSDKYPNWSGEIAAAWEVIGKICGQDWMLHSIKHVLTPNSNIKGYECILFERWRGISRTAYAPSAPEAICKAALLAVIEP